MDLFHRAQEPQVRELTWIKPFDNRMEEILRLKEKSETCPKEMKKVFLSAWGELAAQVKLHQTVASQIVKSELPLQVYYNITLKTDMASAAIDFLIIADEIILVVKFRKKEHIEWDRYDTRFSRLPEAVETRAVEEAACVLADWLTVQRAISQKDIDRIMPILIDEDESEESVNARSLDASPAYTDIREALRIRPDVFGKWLSSNCEISEDPVFVGARLERIKDAVGQVLT